MAVDDVTDDLAYPNEDRESRVLDAVKRYMRLLESGSAPPMEAFLQSHADIADELRPSLQGLAIVHRAALPKPVASMEPPDDEFTAKPIGDFQIVGELGRGGMGVVYEAIQLSLGRHVALKVLPFASGLDEVRLQRFRNEAHAAAALHHTNIVPVYAVGSDRGVHYYAMQKIDGSTLAELIEGMREANNHSTQTAQELSNSGELDKSAVGLRNTRKDTFGFHSTVLGESSSNRRRYYQSVVRMIHQATLAIEHAHQYGIIHRDIKPANLLLDSVGKIWVADFGLAQVQNEASQLTRSGDPMGTLRYMSPEQATGRRNELDHRTDIYSLGVTLYELLTLHPAITGEGYRELLNRVALQDPPAPKSIDPALPIELDTIVRKAIAKIPAERYATAKVLADDLQAWLDDKPIAARPPTVLERLAKWRRRNSRLVVAASGMLALATVGLLITTLVIWREQQHTADALARETRQRLTAQRSFQQARSAVDTFSSLSESELAYRPDMQDLRRSFLEVSLAFYQDFLIDRADDPQLASELEATSARVQQMVDELKVLDNLWLLLQLSDRRVQAELGIKAGDAAEIEQAILEFEEERDLLANQFVGGISTDNYEMSELLREFDESIRMRLGDPQLKRLRQIARQRQLPFTFKTSDVVAALGLTRAQRDDINRIIEESRPERAGRRPGDWRDEERRGDNGREGEGRDGGNARFGNNPRFGGPPQVGDRGRPLEERRGPPDPDPAGSRRVGPPGFGAEGPGRGGPPGFSAEGPGRGGPPFGPEGPGRNGPPFRGDEMWRSPATQNAVKHILDILTAEQLGKWNELIGDPFQS